MRRVFGRITGRSRLLAALIDAGMMGVLALGVALVPSVAKGTPIFSPLALLAGLLCAEAYSLLDVSGRGRTPGKLFLSVRIARSDGYPAKLSVLWTRWFIKHLPLHALVLEALWQTAGSNDPGIISLVRALLVIPELAGLCILVGCAMAFEELRQSLHDVATDTAVFDASRAAESIGFQVLPAQPITEPAIARLVP
jgi:uncharacterized RDD family membrane protein YckC